MIGIIVYEIVLAIISILCAIGALIAAGRKKTSGAESDVVFLLSSIAIACLLATLILTGIGLVVPE